MPIHATKISGIHKIEVRLALSIRPSIRVVGNERERESGQISRTYAQHC